MKRITLLLCAIPFISFGQTKADYENAMSKFMKFYNARQGDSINAMFSAEWDDMKKTHPLWTNEQGAEMLKEYGSLKSFKFIGVDKTDPARVYVFKTVFSKAGVKTTSLTLDKHNRLGTFRLITESDGIDKLLKKSK